MEAHEYETVRNSVYMEVFLDTLLDYLEGGERPRVFRGPAEITAKQAQIVQLISTAKEDSDRLRLALKNEENRRCGIINPDAGIISADKV